MGDCVVEYRYRLMVSGVLGNAARYAFEDFKIEPDGRDTVLIGVLDQAALHGALHRIQNLGLQLIEITRGSEECLRVRPAGGPAPA
jgi:hypothetical protein